MNSYFVLVPALLWGTKMSFSRYQSTPYLPFRNRFIDSGLNFVAGAAVGAIFGNIADSLTSLVF